MKKWFCSAIIFLAGCYTPLNNSGVSTTKPWLEVAGKRVDFDGKQYDSCVQFALRFWPPEAKDRLDLQKTCVSACCWRSEGETIVLDFNKGFEDELRLTGRARKYTPGQITLHVSHSNLVNITKVSVTPRGAIKNNGLVKLTYQDVEDPARLAQLAAARQAAEQQVARAAAQEAARQAALQAQERAQRSVQTASLPTGKDRAKEILWSQAGEKIDTYFYQMNKLYSRQAAVFLLGKRQLSTRLQPNGTYHLTCHARAHTGADEKHLHALDFPCGTWEVNPTLEMVFPLDAKARDIWQLR